jgi:hypothetical protein
VLIKERWRTAGTIAIGGDLSAGDGNSLPSLRYEKRFHYLHNNAAGASNGYFGIARLTSFQKRRQVYPGSAGLCFYCCSITHTPRGMLKISREIAGTIDLIQAYPHDFLFSLVKEQAEKLSINCVTEQD